MTKSTIKIPKDPKHKITIPEEIWNIENLHYGDYIEITITNLQLSNNITENQKDMVLSLDINNNDHLNQYSKAMGIFNINDVKKMLMLHQKSILNDRKRNAKI